MKQEENIKPSPNNDHTTTPPDQRKPNKKQAKKVPFNSDSLLDGIGDYIFESPLGDGKFSKVMLAHHYLTGNQVAIKVSLLLKQPFLVNHLLCNALDDQQKGTYLPCHVATGERSCSNGSIRPSEYCKTI